MNYQMPIPLISRRRSDLFFKTSQNVNKVNFPYLIQWLGRSDEFVIFRPYFV